MTWKPGLRPPEDSKTYLWFAEHEKKVIDQCPNKKCCVFLYKSEKWSYTSKNAERNKAVLKSYLISVGNLALLDKDVHCAKRPRETKGRTDTDIIVYNSYEQNWVFIKKYFRCNKKPGNHLTKQGGFQACFWPSQWWPYFFRLVL